MRCVISRAQQGQIFDTATGDSKNYTQDAKTSFNTAQQDVNTYGGAVGKFDAANPYVNGGEAETATNQATADTAAGLAQSAGQTLQGQAVRTGQNAGGAIAATEEMQQQNERNLVGQQAQGVENRLAARTGYGTAVLGAKSTQEQMQDQLAREQQQAAQDNLSVAEGAAQTPSFMDQLGTGIIQAGSNFAGGAGMALCPAEGSMILMGDGSLKRIEDIKEGDTILGTMNDVEQVLEIRKAESRILSIETENGLIGHVSPTHCLMLPFGGYTSASRAVGKKISTSRGPSKVVLVVSAKSATVYNIVTDGSHTYQADGLWALGDDEPRSILEAVKHG